MECLVSPRKSFSQGQSFRQKLPFPEGLEESCLLAKKGVILVSGKNLWPSVNMTGACCQSHASFTNSSPQGTAQLTCPFLPVQVLEYKRCSLSE